MATKDSLKKSVIELIRELLHFILMDSVQSWIDLQLTLPQLRTIFIIAHNNTSSIKEISGQLGVGEPTASHLVEKLVKSGLVSRVDDAEDRRRVIVKLSEKGKTLIDTLMGWERFFNKNLNNISVKTLSNLQAGLKEIIDKAYSD